MSRRKPPTTPAPEPVLTPEQRAEREARKALFARALADAETLTTLLRSTATTLAPVMGGRVIDSQSESRVVVVFGSSDVRFFGLSAAGLAEVEFEINHVHLVERVEAGLPLQVRTRFQSYATSGNRTGEEVEAQGGALIEAGQFACILLAAVGAEVAV